MSAERYNTPSYAHTQRVFFREFVCKSYLCFDVFVLILMGFIIEYSPLVILGKYLQILSYIIVFLVKMIIITYACKPVGFPFTIIEA